MAKDGRRLSTAGRIRGSDQVRDPVPKYLAPSMNVKEESEKR
jgi:hypothetical protein